MTTLLEEWKRYEKACYGELGGVQARETKQAFFSGALVMLVKMTEAAQNLSEDVAVGEVEKLNREIGRELANGIREMLRSQKEQ